MIELKERGDGFSVLFKGREALRHSAEEPCIHIGEGREQIKQNHSNFTIRDNILSRTPLIRWEATRKKTSLTITLEGYLRLSFMTKKNRLHIAFDGMPGEANRFWLNLPAGPGEHIYGCGEQFTHLDLKGKKVPLWIEEQGVGRGKDLITLLANIHSGAGGTWYTTYFVQPTFVSSGNSFYHFESGSYAEFDFREGERHILHFWQLPEEMVFDSAESAPELLKSLSGLLGRQPALPEWCHEGVWLGVQGGKDIIQEKLDQALSGGVEVAALWAQDWEGIRMTSFGKQLDWNWKYDRTLYKGLPSYIKELDKKKIKFLGYINPMLHPDGDLFKEGAEKGYLVKDGEGNPVHVYITDFPAGLVDLTNPKAWKWYRDIIKKEMIKIGMAGWMADFGEALPVDVEMFSGEKGLDVHNRYPALWARLNFEALEETKNHGKLLYFMRAGYTGSSRYASCIWAGDQLVNWSLDDGLATVIPAGISLGFCGIGNFHSDIGGYTTVAWIKRSRELFMRWTEMAAFTPVMRTHEGNRPDENVQFNSDDEVLAHFARMSKIYAHMKPYHRLLSDEYRKKGLPPIRHPYIHYEDDPILHTLKYQYMYGRDLLVAPVVRPRKKKMKVYLPDDRWVHIWSGRRYGKGRHSVEAPLGKPPVFYREDSELVLLFTELRDY